MDEKNFVMYEYATKSVSVKDQTRAIDMYEALGWEVTSVTPSTVNGVTISLKRDRKVKHKQELRKLERQAEELLSSIEGLERAKTLSASIFSYTFGIVSSLIFGGGLCLAMLAGGSVPAFAVGILLGLAGIALCAVNYPIYKKLTAKKTKQIMPVIDDNEEKLANLLEKIKEHLSAETI